MRRIKLENFFMYTPFRQKINRFEGSKFLRWVNSEIHAIDENTSFGAIFIFEIITPIILLCIFGITLFTDWIHFSTMGDRYMTLATTILFIPLSFGFSYQIRTYEEKHPLFGLSKEGLFLDKESHIAWKEVKSIKIRKIKKILEWSSRRVDAITIVKNNNDIFYSTLKPRRGFEKLYQKKLLEEGVSFVLPETQAVKKEEILKVFRLMSGGSVVIE